MCREKPTQARKTPLSFSPTPPHPPWHLSQSIKIPRQVLEFLGGKTQVRSGLFFPGRARYNVFSRQRCLMQVLCGSAYPSPLVADISINPDLPAHKHCSYRANERQSLCYTISRLEQWPREIASCQDSIAVLATHGRRVSHCCPPQCNLHFMFIHPCPRRDTNRDDLCGDLSYESCAATDHCSHQTCGSQVQAGCARRHSQSSRLVLSRAGRSSEPGHYVPE
jgi:hypothetical protein